MSIAGADKWATIMINVADLAKTGSGWNAFEKTESSERYVMDTFFINFQSIGVDDCMEIDFIAFTDGDWNDLAALTPDEVVYNIVNSNGEFEVLNTADGSSVTVVE